jgi:hypothetical protein
MFMPTPKPTATAYYVGLGYDSRLVRKAEWVCIHAGRSACTSYGMCWAPGFPAYRPDSVDRKPKPRRTGRYMIRYSFRPFGVSANRTAGMHAVHTSWLYLI